MLSTGDYAARTEFIVELARRLHLYGTTTQRLENAVVQVSQRLDVQCEILSNPTGIILSFGGSLRSPEPEITRVLRLPPGDVDLRRLCEADAIAERVLAGRLGVSDGRAALRALDRPSQSRWVAPLTIVSFGLTSASVAALLQTGWAGIATAAGIGWIIGLLSWYGAAHPRVAEAMDAIAALVATVLAAAVASFIAPLAMKSVIVASLIVLLPGLMLTNAVTELSAQQLMAGTARFAGAVAVLLKLTFGTVAAHQLVLLAGWTPVEAIPEAQPAWLEWAALGTASLSFAVLFRAAWRDYPLVMASALMAYLCTRYAGQALGNEAGVFFAGLVVGAASNLYARLANRPGALVRVPGIILLVPGSVGFRSLSFVLERDVFLGLDTGVTLIAVLISLVAGLLFGNLLVPPRHNL